MRTGYDVLAEQAKDNERAWTEWANRTEITLQRFAFERAVRNLDKLEALALIRAAYSCSVDAARLIYAAIETK